MYTFPLYSKIYNYWPNTCHQEMEWFYFVGMMPLNTQNHSVSDEFSVFMSMIRSFSLLAFKHSLGDENSEIASVIFRCLCQFL